MTANLAGHCQQGFDSLAQKLQDIESHVQQLQLSIKTEVDRMNEEAQEIETQFEEAFQVARLYQTRVIGCSVCNPLSQTTLDTIQLLRVDIFNLLGFSMRSGQEEECPKAKDSPSAR